MSKFIMALDAGTTSNRCILFNEDGEICSMAQKEFRQMFPNPGWVEHDANEIWSTQLGVAVEAMSKIGATAADIAAIGITNQRETAIVWNKETGEPVYNAIVWQCRRTADIADALKKKGLEDSYRKKTGLIIDAYFSATKIKWILDNVKGARKLAEEGKSAKEIKDILEADKLDSGIYIMVDTLKYLKKGGRVTAAGAAIGTVLGIKPVLQIHGEKLDAFAKTRGVKQAKKKMIAAVRKELEERFQDGDFGKHAYLQSAYTKDEEAALKWKEELMAEFPGMEFQQDPLSLSVACHIGAGALAVAWTHKIDD